MKRGAGEILLITRLQGTPRCYPRIKPARKAFHDHSHRALLLAGLQGFAEAFGIDEIAAVCAINQSSYSKECAAVLKNSPRLGIMPSRYFVKHALAIYLDPKYWADDPCNCQPGWRLRGSLASHRYEAPGKIHVAQPLWEKWIVDLCATWYLIAIA